MIDSVLEGLKGTSHVAAHSVMSGSLLRQLAAATGLSANILNSKRNTKICYS